MNGSGINAPEQPLLDETRLENLEDLALEVKKDFKNSEGCENPLVAEIKVIETERGESVQENEMQKVEIDEAGKMTLDVTEREDYGTDRLDEQTIAVQGIQSPETVVEESRRQTDREICGTSEEREREEKKRKKKKRKKHKREGKGDEKTERRKRHRHSQDDSDHEKQKKSRKHKKSKEEREKRKVEKEKRKEEKRRRKRMESYDSEEKARIEAITEEKVALTKEVVSKISTDEAIRSVTDEDKGVIDLPDLPVRYRKASDGSEKNRNQSRDSRDSAKSRRKHRHGEKRKSRSTERKVDEDKRGKRAKRDDFVEEGDKSRKLNVTTSEKKMEKIRVSHLSREEKMKDEEYSVNEKLRGEKRPCKYEKSHPSHRDNRKR